MVSILFVSFCVSRFVACDLIVIKTRRYAPFNVKPAGGGGGGEAGHRVGI